MNIQLTLSFQDTRDALPKGFEAVHFVTNSGRILYGVWQEHHRRFYTPGGFYDLADVQSWARVPATLDEARETVHT